MANYRDRLRRLAVNDPRQLEDALSAASEPAAVDPRTLSLARLAALIAVGGSEPTFGESTDAALSAGASADEIVDVLTGIASVVGVPRVVSAASSLALALGVDVESVLD
ncbi:carboxymuconolactone decarboxylase family protein [Microbacterium deminutum]|uniref:Carboxymuconolactone decarboxylase-like domain-containing protein n=1 Tax=Microbacterium deminutum TaxID=344164 RepID=A0ABN2R1S5_9MICO